MQNEKIEKIAQERIDQVRNKVEIMSEFARSNKLAMGAHIFIAALISLTYLIEVFKGSRSIGYVAFVIVLGLASPIAEIIAYSRNKEATSIKHFISLGFGVFYTFLVLTTQNSHAYVYAIPMIIIVTVYNDYKYSLYINLAMFFVNIVQVIVFISNGTYNLKTDSASIAIQLFVMAIIATFAALSSRMLDFNNRLKLKQIEIQHQETKEMFDHIMSISKEMISDIEITDGHIKELDVSIGNTRNAMEQVSSGSNDTATAVQKQLSMTENIQNKINDVTVGTDEIALSVKQTKNAIDQGNHNVDYLVGKVKAKVHPFVEYFKFLKQFEDEQTVAKYTIPAPAQMFQQMIVPQNFQSTREFYATNEELIHDIGVAYQEVIRQFYDAGCRNLQLDDCTWGAIVGNAAKQRYQSLGIDLEDVKKQLLAVNNLALENKPADMVITSHICRGNYHSTFFTSGPYDSVADYVFAQENVDALLLEYDDERSGGFEPLAKVSPNKKVVLGLITSKKPELEDPEVIKARIAEAAQYVPLDRLCLSTQCGFASTEEGNKLTEEQQWAKIALVQSVAKDVWGE